MPVPCGALKVVGGQAQPAEGRLDAARICEGQLVGLGESGLDCRRGCRPCNGLGGRLGRLGRLRRVSRLFLGFSVATSTPSSTISAPSLTPRESDATTAGGRRMRETATASGRNGSGRVLAANQPSGRRRGKTYHFPGDFAPRAPSGAGGRRRERPGASVEAFDRAVQVADARGPFDGQWPPASSRSPCLPHPKSSLTSSRQRRRGRGPRFSPAPSRTSLHPRRPRPSRRRGPTLSELSAAEAAAADADADALRRESGGAAGGEVSCLGVLPHDEGRVGVFLPGYVGTVDGQAGRTGAGSGRGPPPARCSYPLPDPLPRTQLVSMVLQGRDRAGRPGRPRGPGPWRGRQAPPASPAPRPRRPPGAVAARRPVRAGAPPPPPWPAPRVTAAAGWGGGRVSGRRSGDGGSGGGWDRVGAVAPPVGMGGAGVFGGRPRGHRRRRSPPSGCDGGTRDRPGRARAPDGGRRVGGGGVPAAAGEGACDAGSACTADTGEQWGAGLERTWCGASDGSGARRG